MKPKANVIGEAIRLIQSGLTVIPVSGKIPTIKGWRVGNISLNEFNGDGLALVCGRRSGNVEVIDIDNKSDRTKDIVETLYRECPNVVIDRTKSGGYHLIYKCITINGNKKLARIGGSTVIETRGEGGIIVIPPSFGYENLLGRLDRIPTISPSQRERLFRVAEAFSDEPKRNRDWHVTYRGSDGESYRDRFNSIDGIADYALNVLLKHGWKRVGKDRLRRPGKSSGVSATWGYVPFPYILYVFSSNAQPFDNDRAYSPFDIILKLEYNDNFEQLYRDYKDKVKPKQSREG